MRSSIERIDWRDDGATVTAVDHEPAGIDAELLTGFIEDIHHVRRWVGGMTDEQRRTIGREVILLLRDVAPHLICAPMADEN